MHSEAALWAWERGLGSACEGRRVYDTVNAKEDCDEGKVFTGVSKVATRDKTLTY